VVNNRAEAQVQREKVDKGGGKTHEDATEGRLVCTQKKNPQTVREASFNKGGETKPHPLDGPPHEKKQTNTKTGGV